MLWVGTGPSGQSPSFGVGRAGWVGRSSRWLELLGLAPRRVGPQTWDGSEQVGLGVQGGSWGC